VGGIHNPKHLGQSGQPIPEPVALTIPPTRMRRYTDIRVNLTQETALVVDPAFTILRHVKNRTHQR
jgi:hypothetical protein